MFFSILHVFLLKFCLLICLKKSLPVRILVSNMKIYVLLFIFALFVSVDTRAIPSAERDEFGLEPQQRACLYINCPEGEACVAVSGVPQCKSSPTSAPCDPTPCGSAPVCDQFGQSYPSQCDMNTRSCNSSTPLIATPCPTEPPGSCYTSVRNRLSSYSQAAPSQLNAWQYKAAAGTLTHSDIRDSALPSCEVNGKFRGTQCYGHIPNRLFCWCVTPDTGEYRPGSFQAGQLDCSSYSEHNCSLRSDAGESLELRHGETAKDICSVHYCSNGVVTSRRDHACLLCPPQLLSDAKRLLFSLKGDLYRRATGKEPGINTRRTLAWYFDRCDRNRGGELTLGDFNNCHKDISEVSLPCMAAVFRDCAGPRYDSILPLQWKRCFLRDVSQQTRSPT